jgi:hypothetical protein
VTGRRAQRAVAAVRQGGVDGLDGDSAVLLDAPRLQCVDQFVDRLPGDVAHHQVAGGPAHHPGQVDQVGDPDVPVQQVEDVVHLVGRHGDAQVEEHGGVSTGSRSR